MASKAALLMLGKSRAVEIIDEITTQLKRVMQPGGGGMPSSFVDRLADAIVSVEYYMETLQAGRSDPWYMLDNAHTCLQMLANEQTPTVPTVAPLDPSAFARTLQIPSAAPDAGRRGARLRMSASPLRRSRRRPQAGPSQITADPELLALFIEEAREELAKIQKYFPGWEQNPLEQDGLVTVRRSFHTLKGSGRMVGARDLSEFAWAIENLLNRLLDNTRDAFAADSRGAARRGGCPAVAHRSARDASAAGRPMSRASSRAHALASTKPSGDATAVAPRPAAAVQTPTASTAEKNRSGGARSSGTGDAVIIATLRPGGGSHRAEDRRKRSSGRMTCCATSIHAKPPLTLRRCGRSSNGNGRSLPRAY